MLFSIFRSLSGMSENMARGIYYSARSYTGRSDMLVTALEAAEIHPDVKANIAEILKKARSYYGYRNRLVHGETYGSGRRAESGDWEPYFAIVQGQDPTPGRADSIKKEDLEVATHNFGRLSYFALMILHFNGHEDDHTLLDKYRALIRELPNPPNSRQADQNPEGFAPPLSVQRRRYLLPQSQWSLPQP